MVSHTLSCRCCFEHPIYTRYLCAYQRWEIIQCQLYNGRLDVKALKEALAEDGLVLTKLNGVVPASDLDGMSRAIFTTDILAETQAKKGEACSN